MMRSSQGGAFKLERKLVERNRRLQMRSLCYKLASLLSTHCPSKEGSSSSQEDQFEKAVLHINDMKKRIKELKARRDLLMTDVAAVKKESSEGLTPGLGFPVFETKDLGSGLQVVLISGPINNFLFSEMITVLEEEGVEVVNATYCSMGGNNVFYTIHLQAASSRIGYESSRVHQRLKELIY